MLFILQVYKATADYKSAKEMYDYYSAVTDCKEPHFLSLRDIVLHRKQPRKMFVQCNTTLKGMVSLVHGKLASVILFPSLSSFLPLQFQVPSAHYYFVWAFTGIQLFSLSGE